MILVVASDYRRFFDWCRRTDHNPRRVLYVSSAEQVRGYRPPESGVVYIPGYRDHPNWPAIQEELVLSGFLGHRTAPTAGETAPGIVLTGCWASARPDLALALDPSHDCHAAFRCPNAPGGPDCFCESRCPCQAECGRPPIDDLGLCADCKARLQD